MSKAQWKGAGQESMLGFVGRQEETVIGHVAMRNEGLWVWLSRGLGQPVQTLGPSSALQKQAQKQLAWG